MAHERLKVPKYGTEDRPFQTMSPRSIRRLVESGKAVPSGIVSAHARTPWRAVYAEKEHVGPEVVMDPAAIRRMEERGRMKTMYGLGQFDMPVIASWAVVLGVVGAAVASIFMRKPAVAAKPSIWQQAAALPPGQM